MNLQLLPAKTFEYTIKSSILGKNDPHSETNGDVGTPGGYVLDLLWEVLSVNLESVGQVLPFHKKYRVPVAVENARWKHLATT